LDLANPPNPIHWKEEDFNKETIEMGQDIK
jgi:hypothetical protein